MHGIYWLVELLIASQEGLRLGVGGQSVFIRVKICRSVVGAEKKYLDTNKNILTLTKISSH